MQKIDLPNAIRQITEATKRRTAKSPSAFPFFFIVGAGVSFPPIPLAGEIERLCRQEILSRGLAEPPEVDDPLDRYAACFETAFPQAEDRQLFLHELIYRKRISSANFRLAHLLASQKLTNLVFTPNFDDFLSRALRLLDHDVVICDHPKTTYRINFREQIIPQVVHVHGTHWFYDCCNLRGEIENQAMSDLADGITMGQLLDRVLEERSPLVVGYSGWEGDVLMTALRRRLRQRPLRVNLYWFCYKRSEAKRLPDWLTDHANVKIVFPPRTSDASLPGAKEDLNEDIMPASSIFEQFIQALCLRPPRLVSDPLRFFVDFLNENLELEEEGFDLTPLQEAFRRAEAEARAQGALKEETIEVMERSNDTIQLPTYLDFSSRLGI